MVCDCEGVLPINDFWQICKQRQSADADADADVFMDILPKIHGYIA